MHHQPLFVKRLNWFIVFPLVVNDNFIKTTPSIATHKLLHRLNLHICCFIRSLVHSLTIMCLVERPHVYFNINSIHKCPLGRHIKFQTNNNNLRPTRVWIHSATTWPNKKLNDGDDDDNNNRPQKIHLQVPPRNWTPFAKWL